MALTVQEAAAAVRHTLAADVSPEINVLRLINDAGEFLVNARDWRWCRTATMEVSLVDGQDYVSLPAGYRQIVSTPDEWIEWVTIKTITDARHGGLITGPGQARYFAAINDLGTRIELYPTPIVASGGSSGLVDFEAEYQVGWTTVGDGGDQEALTVPVWLESVYLELLKAWARGWEEEDNASLDTRVSAVVAGPLFAAAVKRDGIAEPDVGPINNGAADYWTGRGGTQFRSGIVDGPT